MKKLRIGKLELYAQAWKCTLGFHEELGFGISLEHFRGMHSLCLKGYLIVFAFHLGAGWWRLPLNCIPRISK